MRWSILHDGPYYTDLPYTLPVFTGREYGCVYAPKRVKLKSSCTMGGLMTTVCNGSAQLLQYTVVDKLCCKH